MAVIPSIESYRRYPSIRSMGRGAMAFDLRRLQHFAPQFLAGAISLTALGMGWRLSADEISQKYPAPEPHLSLAAFNPSAPAIVDDLADAPDLTASAQSDIETHDDAAVAQGPLNGSFLESAIAAGASPEVIIEAVKLFSHTLDFGRDLRTGDTFRLVYNRKITSAGRTIDTGDLLYAEIGAQGRVSRFYRFHPIGAPPEFVDASGRTVQGMLLRTPVDGARVTSGFGMRMHPLLGYTRMHQGIDFGAPVGTPVFAAGDGVVEQAAWNGGYGRWVKLRHNGVWETGYGHLSSWTVHAGEAVRQGQVIGYTGSSGESTGPHLHYEVIKNGEKIDPKSAAATGANRISHADMIAFTAEKARIDGLLGVNAGPHLSLADSSSSDDARLRPSETLSR